MNLDLEKVQEALRWLADTSGGDQALAALSGAFEALRRALPTQLDNAEMKYVLERLVQQRSLEGWDKKLEPAEVAGYTVQPFAALFPTLTGISSAQVPAELSQIARPVNYGFQIRASVPPTRF
ncbi:MAG TPA: hypothetical protein VKV26_23530 [Dehalococcoidia bacterium]|nr:hypothetical protein [Dehalococcoidia bacterium]